MNTNVDRLLGILHRCDLNGVIDVDAGTDKNDPHSYIEPYGHLLGPYTNKKGSLLEIGVHWGASMVLWHEFFPHYNFCFLDSQNLLVEKNINKLDPKRYHYMIGDAYEENMRDNVKNIFTDKFDVIIDDGPHTVESQIKCVDLYLPLLKVGGVMCIEDIQSNENLEILKQHLSSITNIAFYLVDMRWKSSVYDDMILVIWKQND